MIEQLIHDKAPIRRGLVADPKAKHYRAMGQAIWLYLFLVLAANRSTGTRLLAPASVAQQMGLKEQTVRSWFGELNKAGYIHYELQGRYFRVVIRKWRLDKAGTVGVLEAGPRQPDPEATRPGQLARSLGEPPDDPYWAEVVANVDSVTVAEILSEVLRVPDDRIRKSRAALFRYLIKQRLKP